MGAVEIRIAPEASPFRGDAYFEGLGAQKRHFGNNRFFFENVFQTYCPGSFVSGHILFGKNNYEIFNGKNKF